MTPEEMERTMQFILEQQARLSVNMEKAEERMSKAEAKAEERRAESDERLTRIEGIQENTALQIRHLGDALVERTEAHEQTRETLGELAEAHARTQGALKELAEAYTRTQGALKELAESQVHSDRRLDALIDIVRGGRDTGQ